MPNSYGKFWLLVSRKFFSLLISVAYISAIAVTSSQAESLPKGDGQIVPPSGEQKAVEKNADKIKKDDYSPIQAIIEPLAEPLQLRQNVSSDSIRQFDLKACFARADERNKEILAARKNLPISKGALIAASARPNPVIDNLFGFGTPYTETIAGDEQQFGAAEVFRTAGKRDKAMNLARANYRLTEFQLDALRFDVHNRVRRAFAELAAAEAYAELITTQREIALRLASVAEARFRNGAVPEAEVLQARLTVMQFNTPRYQAQARLMQASAQLSLLLGETPEEVEVIDIPDNGIFYLAKDQSELVPSPDRQLPSLADLLPASYSQRPDIKASIQQAFANRRALSVARAQRIPDVQASFDYQYSTFIPHQADGGVNTQALGEFLQVTMDAPIFYQRQGETRQANQTWKQSLEQVDLNKAKTSTDVVTAYESVTVSRANILKFQNEILPAAKEVARLARRSYEEGKNALSDAILAQQQYQQSRSSYFDTVVAYQNAWADLEKAVGAPMRL